MSGARASSFALRALWLALVGATVACTDAPAEVQTSSPGGDTGSSSTGSLEPSTSAPGGTTADIADDTGGGTTTGTTGTPELTTEGGTTTLGGSSSEGGSSSGEEPVGLVGRGLLVRYFIDEAASGQSIVSLVDAAPDPLALPISYASGQPEFVAQGGNRGLEWFTESDEGMAMAPVAGTKVASALGGAATATIEVVLDPHTVGEPGYTTRVVHIGGAFATGRLVLGATTTQGFVLRLNDATVTEWGTPVGGLGRSVVHLVFDASQATPQDRARLFIDGVEQVATVSNGPGAGETITLQGDEALVLGNEPDSYRSMDGILYYAAVYDVALDEAEIATNTALLLAGDDTQP